MKKFMKRMMGIVATLAMVVTLLGPGITASAAPVEITSYTWEYKNASGTWVTIPATMKVAIDSLYYDAVTDELTINTAGTVNISGSDGYISAVVETFADGTQVGTNLLTGTGATGESVTIYDVESPVYVYFEITIVGSGYHPSFSTRITF